MKSIFLLFLGLVSIAHAQEKITFTASDNIPITADLYISHQDNTTPFIVLFHQATYSRGAYATIAPKLNKMGFNCMAVDARSGRAVAGITNETAAAAKAAGKPGNYRDALPDLLAAVNYATAHYAKGKLLIWGSSYSASMAFDVADTLKDQVDGLLAFSPNFPSWKAEAKDAITLDIPLFITSAKNETKNWKKTFQEMKSEQKIGFTPKGPGRHGSSALWSNSPDHPEYWHAVTSFLTEHFISQ